MQKLTKTRGTFDAGLALIGASALVLAWPLRGLLAGFPPALLACVMILYMTPGVALARWLMGERLTGVTLIPVAFALSAGLFGAVGVPVLISQQTLTTYLWVCGAITAAVIVAAAVRSVRARRVIPEEIPSSGTSSEWLWAPFLVLSLALAVVSGLKVPQFNDDIWNYLGYVREFVSGGKLAVFDPYFGDRLGELSRVKVNGWLLQQAALSRASGMDPIPLVLKLLNPALLLVAMLAFYTMGRTLLKSSRAALLAGCLYALFFLFYLSSSQLDYGGEFIARQAEDKFLARFVFFPVSLTLAVFFLETKKLRYLGLFAFLAWTVVAVHPVGLAILGLAMCGFGLAHIAIEWRSWRSWLMMASMGVAILSVLAIPALYFISVDKPPFAVLTGADINASLPQVLDNQVFLWPEKKRILTVGGGYYIMHPALLLTPPITVAYLLGVPFLLARIRESIGARLLLGLLLFIAALLYVPYSATLLGEKVVGPGQIYRMAWPIPLAAFLTLGWMTHEALRYAQRRLDGRGAWDLVRRGLPVALVVVLAAAIAPSAISGAKSVYDTNRPPLTFWYGYDPVFRWMQRNIEERAVVLAPDPENLVIPAYAANLNVVSLRGNGILVNLKGLERRTGGEIKVPRRIRDVRRFFQGPITYEQAADMIRRRDVRYVMAYTRSTLAEQLNRLPGFERVDTPSERYSLYRVDYRTLGGKVAANKAGTLLV